MNKTQEYWNILGNINDWIKYSDTKATILLTLYGVIITIVYSNSSDVLDGLNSSNWTMFFSIISIVFTIISIIFSFLCINPKLNNENPTSIIYFGHIQKKFDNPSDYLVHSKNILSNEENYITELTEQIHSNSKIAWSKFSNITIGIRFFVASLGSLILSILFYLTTI
ncbi:Pycsar system effector family protein [Tenacibaculum finnmarkense]|uniref:Pycsar system effector family protein n=1 Tax=Tenacibaculum finnmarkense TaxID=2781243 RepID=UPI001EFB066F|nr:Pycsar system effector family protein [Tenacibaculum finnmarkense]MCG8860079.1 hypothetical protein [Tenacibaculum finnmarkense]